MTRGACVGIAALDLVFSILSQLEGLGGGTSRPA